MAGSKTWFGGAGRGTGEDTSNTAARCGIRAVNRTA